MVTQPGIKLDCRPLSRDEVRAIDRRAIDGYGLPGIVLMENAGRGAAEWLMELGIKGPVVICAGKGNNGGDGFVIARHLDRQGYDVRVLLFCDLTELTGDASINYRVLQAAGLAGAVLGSSPDFAVLSEQLTAGDWIVDALLGTGAQGAIREPYLTAIDAINNAKKKVFAVDLPSGMDCDTGKPLERSPAFPQSRASESESICIRASYTATFVARKIGFDSPAAKQYTGDVRVIDIGIPRRLLREMFGE